MPPSKKHDAPEAHDTHEKKSTLNGLVVIGFFGLVIAGMLLAVYASRYVPETLSRLTSAIYLSSEPAKNADKATTTPSKPTDEPAPPAVVYPDSLPVEPTPPAPKPPTQTYTPPPVTGGPRIVPQTRVVQTSPQLYGRADLALVNVSAGYIRSGRFIEDDTIPNSRDMYVRFTVRNEGTNIASGWRVRVKAEGEDDAIATGGLLYPNGYQSFTLRIENPREGNNFTTRIETDYQDRIDESNERNNNDSIDVDVD